MPGYPVDHAGLEMLPFEDCLRLLASVPVGRVGFNIDGELVVLPVNHAVDGQDVVFRSARGSKLSAAESLSFVVFEADEYDARSRTGWSVMVNGRAETVYDDTETQSLDALGLAPWANAVDRPFWVRIRPNSITGRLIPVGHAIGSATASLSGHRAVPGGGGEAAAVQVFNVLSGEASCVRATPFGEVGTVFSGQSMELVWVSKHGEPIDENWFRMKEVDLIMVMQGQLKLEFDAPGEQDRVLGIGEVLVLPADAGCRAYRWPRDAETATIFMAAYPTPTLPHPEEPVT
jgi:uncharacterized protein